MNERSDGSTRRLLVDSIDSMRAPRSARRRIAQVPHEPVVPRGRLQRLVRADPVRRVRKRRRIDALRFVRARVAANDLPVRPHDLEREVRDVPRQVVVENRTVGRILPVGSSGGKGVSANMFDRTRVACAGVRRNAPLARAASAI